MGERGEFFCATLQPGTVIAYMVNVYITNIYHLCRITMYNQRLNKGHSYTKYIKNEIELNELRLTFEF